MKTGLIIVALDEPRMRKAASPFMQANQESSEEIQDPAQVAQTQTIPTTLESREVAHQKIQDGIQKLSDHMAEQVSGVGVDGASQKASFGQKAVQQLKNFGTAQRRSYQIMGKMIHNHLLPAYNFLRPGQQPPREPYPLSDEEKLAGQSALMQTFWSMLPHVGYGKLAAGGITAATGIGVGYPWQAALSLGLGSAVVYPLVQKALRQYVHKDKTYNDHILRFLDKADVHLSPEEEQQVHTKSFFGERWVYKSGDFAGNLVTPQETWSDHVGHYLGAAFHSVMPEIIKKMQTMQPDDIEQIYQQGVQIHQQDLANQQKQSQAMVGMVKAMERWRKAERLASLFRLTTDDLESCGGELHAYNQ